MQVVNFVLNNLSGKATKRLLALLPLTICKGNGNVLITGYRAFTGQR